MPSIKEKHNDSKLVKATNWIYPEKHQEIMPGRPNEYLGGGYSPIDHAVREHYVKDRKQPIKLSCGGLHIKDSPFFHSTNTEPVYYHHHPHPTTTTVHHQHHPKQQQEVLHEVENVNNGKKLQEQLKTLDNKLDQLEKQMNDLEIRRQFALKERDAVEKNLREMQE